MRKLFVAVALCAVLSASGAVAQINLNSDQRVISVAGEAQVNVAPDEIIVRIGVQACGDTATEARDAEAKLAKAVVSAAEGVGIDAKNIQSDALEVDLIKPEVYDWRACYDTKEAKKYGARQMLVFTVKDVSKLTPLLTKTLEAGAIKVLGVEYRTSQLRKYRDQARSMAIKAAREKAVAMAGELGHKIGEPRNISEDSYYGRDWYYYGSWWDRYGGSRSMSQNAVTDAGPSGSSEDIALGQIAVTARVHVVFDLK